MRYSSHPGLFRKEIETLPSSKTHIVLDEIQRIPPLLDDIQVVMESGHSPMFCMSGSSARKLKRSQANLLGGRAWTIKMHPLSVLELKEKFLLQKALEYGTLPAIYLENNSRDAQRSLRAYVDTYLKEEILAEALVRNAGRFIKFLPLAADASGTIINFSNIGHDTGVSHNTVREYFQILEDTLIGSFLPAFSKSSRKRIIKNPKFYLFDTGVYRALSGKSAAPLTPATVDYGRAYEHFIISEIKRLNDCYEKDMRLSFYRTSNHAEVDLVLECPDGSVLALEIKATDTPQKKGLRGLHSFKQECDKAQLICVCNTPRPYKIDDVEILPLDMVTERLFPH
ncbi:ATP-binding protein [Fibrobacterota bacterium]